MHPVGTVKYLWDTVVAYNMYSVYAKDMLELVGTHYDLSHLNRPRKEVATFQEAINHQEEVGTTYRFDQTLKAFRIIPIQAI